MKFSIVMPAFNAENTILESINSVRNQKFTDFELIVINDGSWDSTRKIVENVARLDHRIRLFNISNSGPGAARNIGIMHSVGEYLAFLDSDDLYHENFLFEVNLNINKLGYDIVCVDIIKVNRAMEEIKHYSSDISYMSSQESFNEVFRSEIITPLFQNKVVSRKLFENISFPEDILVNEDVATMYRLIRNANGVSFVNKALFYYVQTPGSTMNSFNYERILDRFRVADIIREDFLHYSLPLTSGSTYRVYYNLFVILSGFKHIILKADNRLSVITRFFSDVNRKYLDFGTLFEILKFSKTKFSLLVILKIMLVFFPSKD